MSRRISLKPSKSGLESSPWKVNLPGAISNSGKRERHFFKNKSEAETFCQQQRIQLDNYGRNSTSLTPAQLHEASKVFELLKPLNVTLNEVVRSYLAKHAANEKSVSFNELFERYVATKQNLSEAHLRGLKYTLPRFVGLHDRLVSEIQPQQVAAQMEGMTDSVRNSFMRNLRAVFNFGIKRGWMAENPIAKLDFEKIGKKEVVTLTPEDAESLMLAAEGSGDLLAYHALALFAGIRPQELQRLEWKHVDLIERHIEITAEVSKTGRRRIITMEPNLYEWLSVYAARGGNTQGNVVSGTNLRTRLRKVRMDAGLETWTQDVMRHSYASYWLAQHGDINKLTLQMGHESATMLWKHYHKASKIKDAARYWQIAPTSAVNVVAMKAA